MARPISDEELQLKRRARRRLIGAIVLVAAIVVVLPMVLDTEPRPLDGEVSIKIPPPDSSKFTARMVPVPPSAEPKAASGEKGGPDTRSTPKFAAAVGEKASSVEPVAPKPPPAPAPKAAPPATAEAPAKPAATPSAPAASEQTGQFAVQVVALADLDKVKAIQAQMTAAGLKSYTEVVKTAKGDVTRVRAGPYADRAAAEKASDQLKTIGLSGNIVAK